MRSFIELGMNKDESGRRVFDGALRAHRRRREGVRQRRLSPSQSHGDPARGPSLSRKLVPVQRPSIGTDPASGRTGALFRGDGSDPLLIATNTSTEYWQKGASLIHIDADGKADLALPPNSRVYLIAGTQHGGAAGIAVDCAGRLRQSA